MWIIAISISLFFLYFVSSYITEKTFIRRIDYNYGGLIGYGLGLPDRVRSIISSAPAEHLNDNAMRAEIINKIHTKSETPDNIISINAIAGFVMYLFAGIVSPVEHTGLSLSFIAEFVVGLISIYFLTSACVLATNIYFEKYSNNKYIQHRLEYDVNWLTEEAPTSILDLMSESFGDAAHNQVTQYMKASREKVITNAIVLRVIYDNGDKLMAQFRGKSLAQYSK